MGLFKKLFSSKDNKKSNGTTVGRVPKTTVETMIKAGGSPPPMHGISENHLTVMMMHYYHPLMQQNDKTGAQTALSNAIANYNLGLISIEDSGNEYRIIKQ